MDRQANTWTPRLEPMPRCPRLQLLGKLYDLDSRDPVRIRIAQIVPAPNTDATPGYLPRVAKERVALTLSWAEVKQLRDSLADLVSRYEKKNGEIAIPQMPD